MAKGSGIPHGRRIPAVPSGLRVGGHGSLVEDLGLVSLWTTAERDERQAAARLIRRHARDADDAAQLLDAIGLTDAVAGHG